MKVLRIMILSLFMVFVAISIPVPVIAASTDVRMTGMHEIDSDGVSIIEDEITDSYGNKYINNVVKFDTWYDAFITYDLNGAYETFNATIVCSTDTGSDAKMYVGIFADGELKYELKGYTRQKEAEKIELNVSGVGQLSIKTTKVEGYNDYLYFVNSFFTKSDSANSYPKRAGLSDLVIIDAGRSETSNRLFVDVFENVHNGKTQIDAWDNGYVLYNLDEQFALFSGCVVSGADTGSEASMNVKFYLDDTEVFSKNNITRATEQIDFEIDVTGAKVLKIVTSRNDGYNPYLYITDSLLKPHEHTPGEWTVEKEAFCTVEGQKVLKCVECGEIISTEIIPALGHKAEDKWERVKDPTCAVKGEEIQYCSVCGEVAETRAIDKLAHTPDDEWVITKEPTCTQKGIRQIVCKVCGKAVEQEYIEKADHEYGEWKTISKSIWNNTVVKERACLNCGEVERVESKVFPRAKLAIIVLLLIILGCLYLLYKFFKIRVSSSGFSSKKTVSNTNKRTINSAVVNTPNEDSTIEKYSIVYDLREGECKITLVRSGSSEAVNYTVIDTERISVGVMDWEEELEKYITHIIQNKSAGNITEDIEFEEIIRRTAVAVKRDLYDPAKASSMAIVEFHGKSYAVPVYRTVFDEITSHLLRQTFDCLEDVYNRNTALYKIDEIICVGEGSNMLQVKEGLQKLFPQCKIRL